MKLTILATSDMHGYIMPTNFGSRNQNQPFGAAKVATVIKEIRKKTAGPVITIENGDFIQGSPLSYFLAKQEDIATSRQLIDCLNLIGYDAGLLGNHEFNYGATYLRKMEAAAKHPLICANILDETGNPAFGKPYIILEKDGLKIAILGLTTPYIPHWEHPENIKNLTFKSVVETAKKYVPKLREQADIVIVSYHGGFERDLDNGKPTETLTGENEGYQLLQEVKGIDALVTGHQHRQISQKINGVPVVQPGFRGEYVGQIELNIEKNKAGSYVVRASTEKLLATGNCLPDKEISHFLLPISEACETWLDEPLGKVKGSMRIEDPNQARIAEHPYIEFIQKVQMAAANVDVSGTALFNNDGQGFGFTITMRDVVTNYIYPNTLAVLNVTGGELRQALERSASFFAVTVNQQIGINPEFIQPKPQYYNYDMYEGIDYTIDVSKPIGERIVSFRYHNEDVSASDTLEIVVNQYRAVGGGDYAMFDASKIIREVQVDMTELIANYLAENPVIEATCNHNFHVIVGN